MLFHHYLLEHLADIQLIFNQSLDNSLNCLCDVFWMGQINGSVYYMKVRMNENLSLIKLQERSIYFIVKSIIVFIILSSIICEYYYLNIIVNINSFSALELQSQI